jgi:LuxR family maltose regulon positive regulatory protein
MSGNPGDLEPTVVQLDAFLLEAKLSPPQPRPDAVSRVDLIQRGRSSDCRVVGVTAPAGYGKSTLLAQWAHEEDRPVAWVSLDRLDDDPAVLLTLMASAYTRASPGNAGLVTDIRGAGQSVLGRAAPRLASAFSTADPFVLMLDDLHELQSPACHDALGVAISGIPSGSQVVTASRSEQPHLPRLRAARDALEFGASDLALDAHGAEQIFSAAHVELTPELAAAVTRRTEGWPAGLYLAALTAGEGRGEPSEVSGEDRYVADYLYRESLIRLPEEVQRFLRRTAVLDQVCGPLCDAVVGESGSQEFLRTLEASNMFLIPLDRTRNWYRYHALFREFLLGELRRVEPDIIMKLHLRAADWYESNASPATAVEHLLHTTQRDRCLQLVSELVLPTYEAGHMSTLQRWLSTLGDDAIEGYPPLAVTAGWVTALTGQVAEAQRWAAIVDAASFDLVPVDGTASFASARALLRGTMCPDGPEQLMADASLALAEEPPWSSWRDQALCLAGEAHLLAGDVDLADARFAESSGVGAKLGSADALVLSESERAVLAMDRGRWEDAGQHLEFALATIDAHRMPDYATSVLAFSGAARLALHRGDMGAMDRHLTQAMRARPVLTYVLPFLAVRVRLQLAKVYFAIANLTTARHLMREIDDVMLHRPALGVLGEDVSDFRRFVTSSAQAGAAGASPLTGAELRLLPYLQTHLTLREIGERLFLSRNTVSSEVSSIYRKLGVSSRHDAVQQATTFGLLGA